MAETGNEREQESVDDGAFAMYADWAAGEVNVSGAGQEQEQAEQAAPNHQAPEAQKQPAPETPLDALMNLVENHAKEELSSLKEIKQYMEEINGQYKSMRSELQELKQQLAQMRDDSGLGKQAVKGLEKNVNEMNEHCTGFRKNIFQKAADIIKDFKARGKIALYGSVKKFGILPSLKADHAKYMAKAEKMQDALNRFDAVSSEIYAAKSHIQNVGKLAGEIPRKGGKYQKITGGLNKDIGKFDRLEKLREPYAKNLTRYLKLADRAEKKISRLENLEKEAAQAHSTLGKLSDYKKEAAQHSEEKRAEPARETVKKDPAVAL